MREREKRPPHPDSPFAQQGDTVIDIPGVPEDIERPIEFGDTVELKDGALLLVTEPDTGSELFRGYELEKLDSLDQSQDEEGMSVISTWSFIKRIIRHWHDQPADLKTFLERFKKGVNLDRSSWSEGVYFMFMDQQNKREHFESRNWHLLTLGSQRMAKKLFGGVKPGSRELSVVVSIGPDWLDWERHGPFSREELAAFLSKVEGLYKKPRQVRKGLYRDTKGALIKYEVYEGLRLIDEKFFVKGFGE